MSLCYQCITQSYGGREAARCGPPMSACGTSGLEPERAQKTRNGWETARSARCTQRVSSDKRGLLASQPGFGCLRSGMSLKTDAHRRSGGIREGRPAPWSSVVSPKTSSNETAVRSVVSTGNAPTTCRVAVAGKERKSYPSLPGRGGDSVWSRGFSRRTQQRTIELFRLVRAYLPVEAVQRDAVQRGVRDRVRRSAVRTYR